VRCEEKGWEQNVTGVKSGSLCIMHDISIGGEFQIVHYTRLSMAQMSTFVLVLQKETLMRVLVRLVGIRNSNDHRNISELFACATGNRIRVIYCETVKRTTCFCNGLQYLGVVALERGARLCCYAKKHEAITRNGK
jgi:hypothetical protein